jgi:hypothetical protein
MVSDVTPPRVVYCLTRDHRLASVVDDRLVDAIAFFYNDAARLHQAVTLRTPDVAIVDTAAIRPEYGDAGLGPVVSFIRHRAPNALVAVRPGPGTERLVTAEAGSDVRLLPHDIDACADAMTALVSGP